MKQLITKAQLDAGTYAPIEYYTQFITKDSLLEITRHFTPKNLIDGLDSITDDEWAKCKMITSGTALKLVQAGDNTSDATNKKIAVCTTHILLGIAAQILAGRIKGVADLDSFIDSLDSLELVHRDSLNASQLSELETNGNIQFNAPDPFAGISGTVH